jgi:hypothetical protein
MLLKKLVAVVSAVVVIAVPYVKVLADDTVITLDETAKKFVVIDKNLEYRDMLPGEERSSVIKISNSSAENMEFYINGKVPVTCPIVITFALVSLSVKYASVP